MLAGQVKRKVIMNKELLTLSLSRDDWKLIHLVIRRKIELIQECYPCVPQSIIYQQAQLQVIDAQILCLLGAPV